MSSASRIKKNFSTLDLDKFIELSDDYASFHTNDEKAIKGGFKKRICHGVMTLMPISKILGMIKPGEGYVIIEMNTKFHLPIYCEKNYFYEFEEIYSNTDLGITRTFITIKNEENQKISTTEATCKKIV